MRTIIYLAGIALLTSACSGDRETAAELERVKSELVRAKEEAMNIKVAVGVAKNRCIRAEFDKAVEQMGVETPRTAQKLVKVVVLIKDLPAGAKITEENVAQADLHARYITSNMVKPKEFENFAGRELAIPLVSKDFLLKSSFK